jgi:hypothetical protein
MDKFVDQEIEKVEGEFSLPSTNLTEGQLYNVKVLTRDSGKHRFDSFVIFRDGCESD